MNLIISYIFVLFLKTLVEYKLTHFISCGVINEWVCLPITLFISRNNFYLFFYSSLYHIFISLHQRQRTQYAVYKERTKVCDLTRLLFSFFFRLEIMITFLLLWTDYVLECTRLLSFNLIFSLV